MHHIFAHRGVSGLAIENSATAIKLCKQLDIQAVEIDLQLLGDCTAVLFHDNDLKRLANKEVFLKDINKEKMEKISLNMSDKNNEPVLFMDEFINIVNQDELMVNIELKRFDHSIEDYIQFIIQPFLQQVPYQRVLISSFDFDLLKAVRQFSAKVDIALLSRKLEKDTLKKLEQLNAKACHLQNQFLQLDQVSKIKNQVELLGVFTVNDKTRFEQLRQAGVDYVFSDYPHLLL